MYGLGMPCLVVMAFPLVGLVGGVSSSSSMCFGGGGIVDVRHESGRI